MEILRLCDLIYLIVLTILMVKATGGVKNLGDLIGCILAASLLYFVVKAPFYLLFCQEISWPVSQNPLYHSMSGSISVLIVGWILIIAATRRQERGKRSAH